MVPAYDGSRQCDEVGAKQHTNYHGILPFSYTPFERHIDGTAFAVTTHVVTLITFSFAYPSNHVVCTIPSPR